MVITDKIWFKLFNKFIFISSKAYGFINMYLSGVKNKKAIFVFISPGIILLSIFLISISFLFILSFHEVDSFGIIQPGITIKQYSRFFSDPFYFSYFYRSIHVSFYSTIAVLILGYPYAYLMVRSTPIIRTFLTIIILVQFFSSYVMRMYGIMLVIGNNGIVNRSLQYLDLIVKPLRFMYSELGVGIGLTAGSLAFMVFSVSSILSAIDISLEEAAHSLGASRLRTFLEITLPLSVPGIAAGIVIVFLFNISAFVTPTLLGAGHFEMVSNFVYEQAMELLNFPFAGAGAFILLFISLCLVYLIMTMSERMIKGVPKA